MIKQAQIRFEKRKDKIKPLHSVNNGPVADGAIPGIKGNADLFREAGFPMVRNHDAALFRPYGEKVSDRKALTYDLEDEDLMSADERDPVGIVDIHRIFPDFDADENDPASYRFRATDIHTGLTLSTGSKLLFRLGAAIEHCEKSGTYPPRDFCKWARICEHVIRHYNEGWADGFRFGIEYWEVWNEPDCGPVGANPCWQGTCDQFIDLFEIAVKHLKETFPELRIGGPALCTLSSQEYLTKLFPAIRDRQIPIDFFSFHWYGNSLEDFVGNIRYARSLCEKHGYGDIEIILDEYNYVDSFHIRDLLLQTLKREISEIGAAFVSSCMLLAQHEPLDILMYYDARPCTMNGLFSLQDLSPLPLFYAMKMFNRLYTLGNEAELEGLPDGVCGVAAKGKDGAAVELAYYSYDENGETKEFSLNVSGVDPSRVRVTAVDREHCGEEIRLELSHLVMKPNTVLLIEFL